MPRVPRCRTPRHSSSSARWCTTTETSRCSTWSAPRKSSKDDADGSASRRRARARLRARRLRRRRLRRRLPGEDAEEAPVDRDPRIPSVATPRRGERLDAPAAGPAPESSDEGTRARRRRRWNANEDGEPDDARVRAVLERMKGNEAGNVGALAADAEPPEEVFRSGTRWAPGGHACAAAVVAAPRASVPRPNAPRGSILRGRRNGRGVDGDGDGGGEAAAAAGRRRRRRRRWASPRPARGSAASEENSKYADDSDDDQDKSQQGEEEEGRRRRRRQGGRRKAADGKGTKDATGHQKGSKSKSESPRRTACWSDRTR